MSDDEIPLRGRAATHDVYAEETNRDGSDRRRKIGVGYAHLDGSGIQILLDCVPLTGVISVRDKRPRKTELH